MTRPDKIVGLLPVGCSCGAEINAEKAQIIERRQVFDIPEPKLEVTKYRKLSCVCEDCGQQVMGVFPKEV